MAHSPLAGASACSGSPCSPGSYGNTGERAGSRCPQTTRTTHTTVHRTWLSWLEWAEGPMKRGVGKCSADHTPQILWCVVSYGGPGKGLWTSYICVHVANGYFSPCFHPIRFFITPSEVLGPCSPCLVVLLVSASRAAGSTRSSDALCLQCPVGFYSEASGKIEKRQGEMGRIWLMVRKTNDDDDDDKRLPLR